MAENLQKNDIELKDSLDINEVIENIEICVAHGEILKESQKLIAKEYSYFMPKETRDISLVYEDLCIDEPHPDINTLVAFCNNLQNPHSPSILGTIRLTFGNHERIPPLEAMELIDVIDSKTKENKWPHEDPEKNLNITDICELGRLVFSRDVRKDLEVQFFVAKALMQEITNLAKSKEAKQMIAILPNYVYEFALRNDIHLEKINTDKKILFKDTAKAKKTRERYPIYWGNLDPSLYFVDFE